MDGFAEGALENGELGGHGWAKGGRREMVEGGRVVSSSSRLRPRPGERSRSRPRNLGKVVEVANRPKNILELQF